MQLDAKSAAVDNDFLNHILESNIEEDRIIEILNLIFAELSLVAVVHPLVYDKELQLNDPKVSRLFSEGLLNKVEFSDIFSNDKEKKAYYIFLVSELFNSLKGYSIPATGDNILSYWVRKKSLGEVHTVAMCLVCGCGIFLSDDGDSKKLKRHVGLKSLGKIDVYNREEFLDKHIREGTTRISRDERRSLAHSR